MYTVVRLVENDINRERNSECRLVLRNNRVADNTFASCFRTAILSRWRNFGRGGGKLVIVRHVPSLLPLSLVTANSDYLTSNYRSLFMDSTPNRWFSLTKAFNWNTGVHVMCHFVHGVFRLGGRESRECVRNLEACTNSSRC